MVRVGLQISCTKNPNIATTSSADGECEAAAHDADEGGGSGDDDADDVAEAADDDAVEEVRIKALFCSLLKLSFIQP